MSSNKQVSSNRDNPPTGSLASGEPEFLTVGKLKRAHGLHGELVMEVLTDFPERLLPGKIVYSGASHSAQIIRSVRSHNQGLLIAFEGFDSPEATLELRNQNIFVRVDELPELPEGEYYHHQLIGLTVIDQDGSVLGKLDEILSTGANDVYLVRSSAGDEQLLPATNEVILKVDLIQQIIQVKPPEWE